VIARGAFLHDIGKMAIPDEILRKPGKLTPEEQDVMREHCTRGYHMLRKIPFLAGAAEIVFCHQEHFDGSGYPSGLAGARDSRWSADLRGGRHAGRHYQRPALPQGAQLRRGARRGSALLGNAVRPGRGRGFPEDSE
jgi:putative nucleotidyltransferase with HDIG domain